MRTTLRLDDDLFRALEERANREGLTLSEVINRALRQSLATPGPPRPLFRQKTRDLGRAAFDITRANAVAAAVAPEHWELRAQIAEGVTAEERGEFRSGDEAVADVRRRIDERLRRGE